MRAAVNAVGMAVGGGRVHVERLVASLVEVRPDWEVVAYVSPGTTFDEESCTVERVASRGRGRLWWDTFAVSDRARRSGAQVMLNLANHGPLRPSVPSILYQANALYFDRSWVSRMPFRWRAEARLRRELAFGAMRSSAAVLVPSRAMEHHLRSWPTCPRRADIRVVPHGVVLNGVDTQDVATNVPRKGGPARIVSLTYGWTHKDPGLLVDVVNGLARRGVDVEAEASIGLEDDRELVGAVLARARAFGLEDRFRCVGRVDPVRFAQGADVMLLTSRCESFALPVLEAMAWGIPVVASAIPAHVELLAGHGWLFPPGDAEGAAEQVAEVLGAEPARLRDRLLEARTWASQFTWERSAEQVAEIMEAVVATR